MMGLGHASTEEFKMDNCNEVAGHKARNRIPVIMLILEINSVIMENPIADGPKSAKGGEFCSIPTPPAIINAIY